MIQSKSKAVLLLCIIFLLGMVAGASLATFLTRQARAKEEFRGAHSDRIVEHFKNRLQLTPDQVSQLRSIMTDTDRQMEHLYQPLHPQQDAIFSNMQERVRKILAENQRKEYDKMIQEWEKRHGKRSGEVQK
jgi:uncharacterized protein HemX